MTSAAAIASEPAPSNPPESSSPPRASLSIGDGHGPDSLEARVERAVFRDAIVGAIIGVLVLVPAWAGLVAIALRNAGTALLPPIAMAAGVGVIAGVFMGGWAGTLVGASKLEHYEHETRPKAP